MVGETNDYVKLVAMVKKKAREYQIPIWLSLYSLFRRKRSKFRLPSSFLERLAASRRTTVPI